MRSWRSGAEGILGACPVLTVVQDPVAAEEHEARALCGGLRRNVASSTSRKAMSVGSTYARKDIGRDVDVELRDVLDGDDDDDNDE